MPTIEHKRTAWDWIGFGGEGGQLRNVGGRTLYEAADNNGGQKVRLARLVVEPDGLRQINRYVNADMMLEFVPDAQAGATSP